MPPHRLRAYQLEPFRAILAAAERHDADIITVRMSRQAGKNELSAHAEAVLMAYAASRGGSGVKAAPTQNPQAIRSLARLASHLRACGYRPPTLTAGGDHASLGRAEWWFGSGEPGANVVGATASIMLEFDEAQDFDQEKHDKDYSPMAASTAAPRIYYGTAWSDFDLLETARRDALERDRTHPLKDGTRRVFDVPWTRVAEELPAYGLFVESERARLGHTLATPHITFQTQYELLTIAGAGRLFNPAQLALLQGTHDALDAPQSDAHNVYVAGLDVGGANLSNAADPDETVLTIARARFPGRGRKDEPIADIVAQYAWSGLDHDHARGEIVRLLALWRVVHTVIDATGIGEPIANHLSNQLGARAVTALKFTRETKSELGFDLLSAVNTGALHIWKPGGAANADHANLTRQLRLCRRELKAGKLLWYVAETDGHDDRLVSVALALRAAQRGKPRTAQQRSFSR